MKIFKQKNGISPRLAIAVLGLALAGSPVPAHPRAKGATQSSITEDLSDGASFTFKIGPNLPEFRFKVIPEVRKDDALGNATSTVRDIEIFRGDSKQPVQRLEGCKWSDMQPPRDSEWFSADDFNFDGYQDIYAMTVWGATGNEAGCIWIFDPKTERFIYSREFSELSVRKLDPDSKTILSFWNGGGGTFSGEKYKIEKNLPVLFWTEKKDWDWGRKQFHCVEKEISQSGKAKVVRDVWGKSLFEGGPCDPADLFEGKKPINSPDRDNQPNSNMGAGNSGATAPVATPAELNEQGMTLMKDGDYEEAASRFTMAALLSPSNALYANNVGFAFYKMKKYESAVKWFQKAVEADPMRAVAYLNLGDAYAQLSWVIDARDAYTKYLEIAPNSRSAPEVRKKLESLPHTP